MMMMEHCGIASMLFMGGSHLLELLVVVGLIIFLGETLFRSRAERPTSAG